MTLPVAGAVLAAIVAPTAPAGAVPVAAATATVGAQCPTVMKTADVRQGMRGQGLTVTRGKTPEPFAVEVLGVLKDGLAPGKDLIVIEVSDLPGRNVISKGGGIWAGMSGSPVYVNGKLLGAVSYGFTWSPSPVGGLTPAEDMWEVLGYPTGTTSATAAASTPESVAIPDSLRARVAATGTDGTSMRRLPTPLGVSGLRSERVEKLQKDADAAGKPFVAHASGSGSAPSGTTTMSRPVAGGNFVAAISYGDVTAAGTGTTTAVCGSKALAFGHPMAFAGPTQYGANDASALTIVKDEVFGSFKFATISAPFGTVDQDRLSAIRGRLGAVPRTTAVRTAITNVDLGKSRNGVTRVTDPSFLPWLGFYGVIGAYDSVFDEIGDGSASVAYTIKGTRAGGEPFQVYRDNHYASTYDLAEEPSWDIAMTLDRLLNQPYEKVRINSVDLTSKVTTNFRQLRIVDAKVSVDGGDFRRPEVLRVKPGALVTVRVVMQPYQSLTKRTVDLSLRVPTGTAGQFGLLDVMGGSSDEENGEGCLISDHGCSGDEPRQSLDTVLKRIRTGAHNNDVRLGLYLEDEEKMDGSVSRTTVKRVDQIVRGRSGFYLEVVR